jgi:hypothetical protein
VNFRTACALILSIVFITACKKQDDNVFLQNETTAGFEGYSYVDSLKIQTCTVREDSLKTDSLSHNLLGIINDPDFGVYTASSFVQFKLPQLGNVISSNTLDSAVLFLQFTSNTAYYGDINSDVTFNVFELSESMNNTISHSNQTYNYDPNPIGTFTGRLNVTDSLTQRSLGKSIKGAPGISIKLSSAFAQKLFNANSSNLSSQDNFLSFLKGIALVPVSIPAVGKGAIAAINLKGSFTKIRVYYNDTMQSDFNVQTDSKRFSSYAITGQGAQIMLQKSFAGNANFDTTFVMAMAGAKTKIKLPNLFSIIKNNGKLISVGKAEVIIRPLAGSNTSIFPLPTRLLLFSQDEATGLNAGLIDLIEPFYGGSYNSANNYYKFNITRYIQSLFTDYQNKGVNNNRGLFLTIPSDFPVAPSRLMIDARKGLQNAGIEFRLVFTEL